MNKTRDEGGHLKSEIVAMDAVVNSYPLVQFTRTSIRRDLDKAFCGFCGIQEVEGERFDIATGTSSPPPLLCTFPLGLFIFKNNF
jgi:hypothetical protein